MNIIHIKNNYFLGSRTNIYKYFIIIQALIFLFIISTELYSAQWRDWQYFKSHYISHDGRVIDPSSSAKITTSEGQSYAMFFSLVANDKSTFNKLLTWTESNLAKGDLINNNIAWLWGKTADGSWQIKDNNYATDADLWITYNLYEASRLWKKNDYLLKAKKLQSKLFKRKTYMKKFGDVLLPGPIGFYDSKVWKLNPSYYPPHLMRYLSTKDQRWSPLEVNANKLILDSSPNGYIPNWAIWTPEKGWLPKKYRPYFGSYDAIRVYLWIGIMPENMKNKNTLTDHVSSFIDKVTLQQKIPEKINVLTGESYNQGPIGFTYALIPLLRQTKNINNATYLPELKQPPIKRYYDAVLYLFSKGFTEKKYRFNLKGELIPSWNDK